MASVVYKYPLPDAFGEAGQEVAVPGGGVVLHVGEQGGVPTLWVLLKPHEDPVVRTFRVVRPRSGGSTGWGVSPRWSRHHGSVQAGLFVWHVFEAQ